MVKKELEEILLANFIAQQVHPISNRQSALTYVHSLEADDVYVFQYQRKSAYLYPNIKNVKQLAVSLLSN